MNTDVHLLGNYKTSVYSCGTGHEPIKCEGVAFCRDNPFLFYVEFIVTADVGNFLLFQVYNTLNSYPSSQEVNGARQCVLQVSVAPGFQGIVEGDDGAVAGVAHHVG